MANTCKEEFRDKLHLDKITSIIYIPKGEKMWVLGVERLLPLIEKFYKFSHVHPERQASVAFKTPRGACLNHKLVV